MPDAPPPLPSRIRQLDPALIQRWSISDDVDREAAIEAASTNDLTTLIEAVDLEVLRAIDEYLEEANDHQDVVWLHDIAQAALEAGLELDRRG